MSALAQSRVVAGRNLTLLVRSPRSLISMVLFPTIFFLGFLAVLQRLMDARGFDYAQYLPPVIVIQALFFTAMASGFFMADDARTAMLARSRSMPISPWAFIVGRVAADAVRGVVCIAVVTGLGAAFGFRFQAGVGAAVAFVAVALLFVTALAAGCGAVGIRIRDGEAVVQLLSLPYLPLLMLSTGFVPATDFPHWLEPIVRNSPVSHTVEALRALASGGPTTDAVLLAVGWLTALLVLFGTMFTRAYRRVL